MGEHKHKGQSIELEEQWKTNGQCEKCRRKKYCGKMCKARETLIYRELIKRMRQKGIPFV